MLNNKFSLKNALYPFLLFVIVAVIAVLTYKSGTFLTGWDTLHPEFDFGLNFQRLLSGVWRGEQGLGAVAGHSHMADLPRVLILWILHFALPLNVLRYAYFFLCLFFGPLGIYYLVKHISWNVERSTLSALRLTAFLSALFYLFNLATVQVFYAPFEMFATQYAALPWIVFFSLRFLNENNSELRITNYELRKKSLVWFVLVTLLATPQAYAAHLWYPLFGMYALFLICYALLNKKEAWIPDQVRDDMTGKSADTNFVRIGGGAGTSTSTERQNSISSGFIIKKSLFLIALTLLLNSFWLLPNLYYITTQGNTPKESKQNRIYSQEYRLRNREHGYIQDIALNRGFYFNWSIYKFENNKFDYLMPEWRKHLNNPFVAGTGYILFATSIVGIYLSFKKRLHFQKAIIPFFAIPFIFLINHTPPFEWIFDFLTQFSIFEEALRFVFTKFFIVFQFALTIYFSVAIYFLLHKIRLKYLVGLLVSILLIFYTLPIFQGKLISSQFKITIPQDYFKFWQFMNQKEDGLVLSLPLHSFSGWQYNDWAVPTARQGYQGSGFLWFGLKQSLLDRDFDRWDKANEQAFRELQYAFYSQNIELIKQTLTKYNIRYIVWDQSSITPNEKNRNQILFRRETEQILTSLIDSNHLSYLEKFGTISVYSNNHTVPKVHTVKNAKTVSSPYVWNFEDVAYKAGDYITEPEKGRVYPFRTFLNSGDRVRKDILQFDQSSQSYFLKTQTPIESGNLHIPSIVEEENIVWANTYVQKRNGLHYLIFSFLLPKGLIQDVDHLVRLNPISKTSSQVKVNDVTFAVQNELLNSPEKLYLGQSYLYTKDKNYINDSVESIAFVEDRNVTASSQQFFSKFPLKKIDHSFENVNVEKGVFIPMDNLPHESGYILIVKSKNSEGLPLRMCLKNAYSNVCALYDELTQSKNPVEDYFVIPPYEPGIGYGLAIDNISYGNYQSRNDLYNVTLIPFPYRFLSTISYENKAPNQNSVLVSNTSYNKDWVAKIGTEKLPHVLVNNWANGWLLPKSSKLQATSYKLIFWPEYLEYLGFVLAGIGILLAIVSFNKDKKK
ncbi:MAG: hypothetical protein AAB966_01115 [Patescibacteria group bacterium]